MTETSSKTASSDGSAKPDTKVVAMLGGSGGLGLAVGKGVGEAIGGPLGGWIGLGIGFAVGALLGYVLLRLSTLSLPFHPTVSSFVATGLIIAIASAIGYSVAGVAGGWIALAIFCVLAFLYGFVTKAGKT